MFPSSFRFVKKNHITESIILKYDAKFERGRMSEKIKMVIVQYLFMHLSVEAIRSKQEHFHSYTISPFEGENSTQARFILSSMIFPYPAIIQHRISCIFF